MARALEPRLRRLEATPGRTKRRAVAVIEVRAGETEEQAYARYGITSASEYGCVFMFKNGPPLVIDNSQPEIEDTVAKKGR